MKGGTEEFTPAAEGHGLCPWMNAPAFGRDVAPLGREEGCHGLYPWSSTGVIFFQRKGGVLCYSSRQAVSED
ncbi:MAG: hypothetical protein A2162_05435 [Deltaproteobacteria bacterium RBG_13_52_11b]|nr:MAG: hypothetical protein A2162_05435 [Deltaproteobacteria bacterium RBG_13_52_11b]